MFARRDGSSQQGRGHRGVELDTALLFLADGFLDGFAGIVQAALDRTGGTAHRFGDVTDAHIVIIIENDGGLLLVGKGIDKAADDLFGTLLIQDPVRGIRIQSYGLKGKILVIEGEGLFPGLGTPDLVQADVGDDLIQPRGDGLGTLQPVQIHIGLFIGLLNGVLHILVVLKNGLGVIEDRFIGCFIEIREGGTVASPDLINNSRKLLIRRHFSGPSFFTNAVLPYLIIISGRIRYNDKSFACRILFSFFCDIIKPKGIEMVLNNQRGREMPRKGV